MKKTVFLPVLISLSVFVVSCKKQDTTDIGSSGGATNTIRPLNNNRTGADSVVIVPTVVTMFAGQTYNAGTITITNDLNFAYITYTAMNSYVITQTHLYAGTCALIPVNPPGNPIPGQFPYSGTHNDETSVIYQVPLSVVGAAGSSVCIAAHAVVKKLSATGQVLSSNSAWGSGIVINPTGNWGMKVPYIVQ